jgi:hypothetical protein
MLCCFSNPIFKPLNIKFNKPIARSVCNINFNIRNVHPILHLSRLTLFHVIPRTSSPINALIHRYEVNLPVGGRICIYIIKMQIDWFILQSTWIIYYLLNPFTLCTRPLLFLSLILVNTVQIGLELIASTQN